MELPVLWRKHAYNWYHVAQSTLGVCISRPVRPEVERRLAWEISDLTNE